MREIELQMPDGSTREAESVGESIEAGTQDLDVTTIGPTDPLVWAEWRYGASEPEPVPPVVRVTCVAEGTEPGTWRYRDPGLEYDAGGRVRF